MGDINIAVSEGKLCEMTQEAALITLMRHGIYHQWCWIFWRKIILLYVMYVISEKISIFY